MNGSSGPLEVLILIGWRDGPLEGILRREGLPDCWYFTLLAERLETSGLDDRIFAVRKLSSPDSAILIDEFGNVGTGMHVWPVVGGTGSNEARRVVDELLSSELGTLHFVVRTRDFIEILDVWDLPSDS